MPIYSQRSGRDERSALFPPELLAHFDDRFVASFDLFAEFVARLALQVCRATGLDEAIRGGAHAGQAVERLGLPRAAALSPASWILATLASRQWIGAEDDARGRTCYSVTAPLPQLDAAEILERQRQHDPSCLPGYDIALLAASRYPDVMGGRTSGEQALFGSDGIVPWMRYFSADNPLYAVSNAVGAVAGAQALGGDAGAILEIGAGLGSGTDALLAEIERSGRAVQVSSYRFTEVSPLFLKRARRLLAGRHPGIDLKFDELDIDRPFPAQVAAPGGFALVYGVNVLHVAHDLGATLAQLRGALRPGGMLVMAECVRPFARAPLPIEFVFNLLESFRNPVLVDGWRPNGGFLTPEQWVAALTANGFEQAHAYPDVASIRDAYPSFMVAAIVARRT